MSVLRYVWLWFFALPQYVFAVGMGESLSQYSNKVCGAGFAPAWMCRIGGAGGTTASDLLFKISTFVTDIAAGVGVCVFIYACIQIVIAQGQDDKLAAAKKMAVIALVGVFLALSANAIISALWTPSPPALPLSSILRTIFGL